MFYGLLSEFPHRYSNFDSPANNNSNHNDLDLDEDEEEVGCQDSSDSLGSVSSSISSSVSSLSPESGRHSEADDKFEEATDHHNDNRFGFHNKIQNIHVTPPTKNRYAATELSMYTDRRYPPPIEIVRVPDITSSAFRKMIDFIYNDFDSKNLHLNENNVMAVLYAGLSQTKCCFYLPFV